MSGRRHAGTKAPNAARKDNTTARRRCQDRDGRRIAASYPDQTVDTRRPASRGLPRKYPRQESHQSAQAPFGDVAHQVVRVDGMRFHYVVAGSGEPVVLLPGWPEMSWIAWRKVIPLLVKAGRQVYVLEPRGFGDSDKPEGGYDVDIVAHDIGTWIGHAHAAAYPGDVKRLVLTEANVPGVSPPAPAGIPSQALNLKSWQFTFNRLDDLPEILVQGRERAYLAWLFATKTTRSYAIEPAAFDEYVRVFSAPGVARAGFAWYRAVFTPDGLAQAKARAAQRLP